MMNKYYASIFYLIILLILQLTLVELISYKNFKPDLLLIGLIYFTLRFGQIQGMIVSFFFGLSLDILSNGVIGANAISKVIATFITGYFSETNSNKFEYSTSFFLIVFFVSLIEKIIYIFVAISLDFKSLLIVVVRDGLIPTIVTLVFSLFVLVLPKEREIR